eukprot:GHVL01033837.1.p1 GENE.GHVL01033837.1~~GHVL01033837.1.p1  ORF type:complete len:511 (-),score=77.15 GHVL01033837.1:1011-2543(-)
MDEVRFSQKIETACRMHDLLDLDAFLLRHDIQKMEDIRHLSGDLRYFDWQDPMLTDVQAAKLLLSVMWVNEEFRSSEMVDSIFIQSITSGDNKIGPIDISGGYICPLNHLNFNTSSDSFNAEALPSDGLFSPCTVVKECGRNLTRQIIFEARTQIASSAMNNYLGELSSAVELVVEFHHGRHCLKVGNSLEEHSVWLKLADSHRLLPGDAFRIGNLEFTVLRFNTGVGGERGLRQTMEDEEICQQHIELCPGQYSSYFAVYDGHGGRECAAFVQNVLHKNLTSRIKAALLPVAPTHYTDISEKCVAIVPLCLRLAFKDTDDSFLLKMDAKSNSCGCAAVVVVVIGNHVWCANCGDSRAVLCRGGKALQLSRDHRPTELDEKKRIEDAGGFVSYSRVLGRLAVSRAFGDYDYKQHVPPHNDPLVISEPEIRSTSLTDNDEFLLLACDGLFDVFETQEAVTFVRERLAAMPDGEQEPQRVVKQLLYEAIGKRKSRDNVTAIIVTLKRCISIL